MILADAELHGYIGVFNGLGEESIAIDFTRCRHAITVIVGKNGTGKSTIFDALTPLPDDNSCFIPGKPAKKIIGYTDTDANLKFRMTYIHEVRADGSRATARAYIGRAEIGHNSTGTYRELNPSGNITTAREIIYDIFKLDANFIALSQLSSSDRGLADKTPAERKKFINSIIEILEVYNNMYKTLTKRSASFKAIINSLVTKIDTLGDEESLKLALASLENRIGQLMIRKDCLVGSIAVHSNNIIRIDPQCDIRAKYDKLNKELNFSEDIKKQIAHNVNDICHRVLSLNTPISDLAEANNYKLELEKKIVMLTHSINFLQNDIEKLLQSRELDSKALAEKQFKLSSLGDQTRYNELDGAIGLYKEDLAILESYFKNINLKNPGELTKDEYIIGLNMLKEIKDSIDILKSDKSYHIIQSSIADYIMKDTYPDIQNVKNMIIETEANLNNVTLELNKNLTLKELASRFEEVPSDCKLMITCVFVKDIIKAHEKQPDILIAAANDAIKVLVNNLEELRNTYSTYEDIIVCINAFKVILRQLHSYSNIIKKLPYNDCFVDTGLFLQKLLDGYKFEEINKLYEYIDYGNMIEVYNEKRKTLYTLELELAEYSGKSELIRELTHDIVKLQNNISDTSEKLMKIESVFTIKNNECNDFKTKLVKFDGLIASLESYNKTTGVIDDIRTELTNISDDVNNILLNETLLIAENEELANVISQLTPLVEDRDKLNHAIKLLREYNTDLAEYGAKYEKSETFKFHSSPTTGIQTIFMEVYMNKIINMANQLLTLLFDSKFVLMPFVINENEFRIPCAGSGLMNDDISSMSTSQICMISMILSFALLYHSSTKYNILKLDEIDGGLDPDNRLQFIKVLDDVMLKLKCQQAIMISHNSELSLDNTDVIVLKMNSKDRGRISGNIIYEY